MLEYLSCTSSAYLLVNICITLPADGDEKKISKITEMVWKNSTENCTPPRLYTLKPGSA
jgi:hypothetical protein